MWILEKLSLCLQGSGSASTKPPQPTAYGMEISAEKTKLMTNNTSGINTEIKVNGQKLQTITIFKYLVSVITDEGFEPLILSRIAQTTAALTRLKPVRYFSQFQDTADELPCHIRLSVRL